MVRATVALTNTIRSPPCRLDFAPARWPVRCPSEVRGIVTLFTGNE
jgi:hypothetical protein